MTRSSLKKQSGKKENDDIGFRIILLPCLLQDSNHLQSEQTVRSRFAIILEQCPPPPLPSPPTLPASLFQPIYTLNSVQCTHTSTRGMLSHIWKKKSKRVTDALEHKTGSPRYYRVILHYNILDNIHITYIKYSETKCIAAVNSQNNSFSKVAVLTIFGSMTNSWSFFSNSAQKRLFSVKSHRKYSIHLKIQVNRTLKRWIARWVWIGTRGESTILFYPFRRKQLVY